jgi:hypothetical protein
MIRFPLLQFTLAFAAISLIGCENDVSITDPNEEFAKKFALADLNTSLQLGLEGDINTFDEDSNIAFYIYNKSNHDVLIDHNADTKLFTTHNSEWIEIENAISYPDSLPLLALGTPLLDSRYTWVHPVLSDEIQASTTEDIMIRILILGELMENDQGTGDLVGAYVDVFIEKP